MWILVIIRNVFVLIMHIFVFVVKVRLKKKCKFKICNFSKKLFLQSLNCKVEKF